MKRGRGFTLIELLITLSFVLVMVGIGYPKVSSLYLRQKVTLNAESMFIVLQRARTEAIRRQGTITVCASADLITCEDDWQQPIIVFNDVNNNKLKESTEELVTVSHASEYLTVNRPYLSFSPFLQASTTAATLSYCLKYKIGVRALVISNVGRIRLETDRQKIKCQSVRSDI